MNDGQVKHLGRKMASGALWMVLLKLAMRGIGLISTIVLARILVPQDFGLVAMATSLVVMLEMMSEFQFDMALIKDQQAADYHYNTAWTLNIIKGLVTCLLIVAIAYPAAVFFEETRLEVILYVLAGASLMQGFENIGVVAFRKDLEFSKEFNYRVLPKIISFVATVALAIAWKSYWALIAGIVIGQIARIGLSYVLHPYRPSLSVKGFRDIMGFSKWLVVNSMLNFVNTRGDTFIVAKMLGPAYVGIYNIAYEISNLVTTELTFPIQRAIFPGYAKIAANRELLIKGYLKVLYLTVAVACPLGIGIALLADPLVRVFLGDQWLAAIPVIQILGFAGVFRMFSANNGPVYLALGKPWIVTWLTVVNILAALPLMAYGIYLAGLYGAAWAILFGAFARTAMNYFIVVKLLGVTWGTLARVLWRTIAATAALAVAIEFLLSAWPQETLLWSAAKLAAGAAGGGIVYLLAAIGLWYLSGRPAGSAEAFYLEKLEARFGGIRCLKPSKA